MRVSSELSWLPSLFVFALLWQPLFADDPANISVSGNAEIRVVPDQVVLTAAVESRAKTVADACKDNDAKVRGVLELLKSSGIEEKHIHTQFVFIEPIMRHGEPNYGKGMENVPNSGSDPFGEQSSLRLELPVGYTASRQFAITLVDLAKFETIYKGIVERGINRVPGIEFRTSQLRKHRDEARLQAVRAAREKAQAMAKELGAKLAAVKSIHEIKDNGYMPIMMQNSFSNAFGDRAAESSESFAVGQITIRAAVDVVFDLSDAEIEE